MAGLFGISVNPKVFRGNFSKDLFLGSYYQQHLGEEYAGLSTLDKGKIQLDVRPGLLRSAYNGDLGRFGGSEGMGYCGPFPEPYFFTSRGRKFSICFSGNAPNLRSVKRRFLKRGHVFGGGSEIEVFSKILVQGRDIVEGMRIASDQLGGAYTLLILAEEGLYASRSPSGRWPLILGRKRGAAVIASDPCGFDNLGFKITRSLKAGETILLKNGLMKTVSQESAPDAKICTLLWVYTNFPNAPLEDVEVYLARKRLGACLARKDRERGFIPDLVIPVPYSGKFHAIGYHEEFCNAAIRGEVSKIPQKDELLLKYPYAGRSQTPLGKKQRSLEADIKLLAISGGYRGKVAVVCDDSIVRGTQMRNRLVAKLRHAGIKEIHLRISNPEQFLPCVCGKTTKTGEPLASRLPDIGDRIKYLKVESLVHNSIDDLIEAIGLPQERLCLNCLRNFE